MLLLPQNIKAKVNQVLKFEGLERKPVEEAEAGDIVLINGIDEVGIGATLCDPEHPDALPALKVDEPTLTMNFLVNASPLAGREGRRHQPPAARAPRARDQVERRAARGISGRHRHFIVRARRAAPHHLDREHAPRGLRARGVAAARRIQGDRRRQVEPYELLTVDVKPTRGAVMEELGRRRGELLDMVPDGKGRVRLDFRITARGLIGFQGEFMTLTRGTGIMSHVFDGYGPMKAEIREHRNGVLVSQDDGAAVAYALWKLQERGRMFVNPGDPVYEGMIIGIHSRDNDLVVNPIRTKQLTNIRAAGKDEAILLTPPIQLTLEYAVEFIADDELAEITPKSIRLRKRFLKARAKARISRGRLVLEQVVTGLDLHALALHPLEDADESRRPESSCRAARRGEAVEV